MNTRKYYIDYLRVIAVFAVISIHITASFYAKFGEIQDFDWWVANILNSAARFSVPVFVMISGAVLLGRAMPVLTFFKKRSSRLLPAVIFWNVFYMGFNLYIGDMDTERLLWFVKIGLFADGRTAGHLWYLSMILCLMMFAPFINQFVNGEKPSRNDLLILLFVMFVFFLLNGMASVLKQVLNIRVAWFTVFPWFVAYFICGHYLDKYGDKVPLKSGTILLLIVFLSLLGGTLNFVSASSLGIVRDYFILDNAGPILFLISVLIFLLLKKLSPYLKENKLVSSISEASFGMYLIHPVYIYMFKQILPEYYVNGATSIFISLVLTSICSFLSIYLLRKSKLMQKVC